MLAHAEHVLIVRLGHGQALIEVELGVVQTNVLIRVGQNGVDLLVIVFRASAQGGYGRHRQGAVHQGRIGPGVRPSRHQERRSAGGGLHHARLGIRVRRQGRLGQAFGQG